MYRRNAHHQYCEEGRERMLSHKPVTSWTQADARDEARHIGCEQYEFVKDIT